MAILEIDSWDLESIRISLFMAEPPPTNNDWWSVVTGKKPDISVNKRQMGVTVEEGEFEGWKFSLGTNLNQNRVDWVASSLNPSLMGPPSIGQYVEQSTKFCEALKAWLIAQCPSVVRIAYGGILLFEVPSRKDGYSILASCLPIIKFDIDNWSDFLFQINKPGESNVIGGLLLNRLSRWNVSGWVRVSLDSSRDIARIETYTCRLELDINTSADIKNPIEHEKLPLLLSELKDIADIFAAEGYQI